jgi:hypothetical protein
MLIYYSDLELYRRLARRWLPASITIPRAERAQNDSADVAAAQKSSSRLRIIATLGRMIYSCLRDRGSGRREAMAQMAELTWRDEKLGARVRVALWLYQEVGEGNTFSKQQLRRAIPGIEQVDRRMRELRDAEWVIKTYRDMDGLRPGELYLEKIGIHVWEPGNRTAGLRSISGRVRREVMERDLHRCVRCGISAGEEYPDDPGKNARLTVGHVNPHKHGSDAQPEDLVTECDRCNEAAKHLTGAQLSPDQVWDRIEVLPKAEKVKLLKWMLADRRVMSRTEEAWARYRQLPAVKRDEIRQRLTSVVGTTTN